MSSMCVRVYSVSWFILAIASNAALGQEAADWKKFESKEYKFSVEFPQADVQSQDTENAKHFFAALPGTDTDFRVGVSDVAEPPTNREETVALMHRIRDGVAESFEAKVSGSKEIDFKGLVGLQFTLNVSIEGQDLEMACRYFIVRDQLYQIMVVRYPTLDLAKETQRFFDSLEIVQ